MVCHSCHALRQDDVGDGPENDISDASDDEQWLKASDSDIEDDEEEELDEEGELLRRSPLAPEKKRSDSNEMPLPLVL